LTYGPGNSVEFLGYRMTVVQDEIRIAPSVENFVSFERAFKRKLAYARKVPTPRTVARVRNFVLSWSSAFRLWDAVAEHRKKHLKVIHDLTS
jgi:hypothetical protein